MNPSEIKNGYDNDSEIKQDGDKLKGIGEAAVGALNEESIRAEIERQSEDSAKIRYAFDHIASEPFGFIQGVPYANIEEEGFSGDAASLFMLVQFQKEDGPKTELVKIGWGEFSKQTFTKGAKSKYSDPFIDFGDDEPEYRIAAEHEVLRNLPFDVYCVNQYESYFADEKTKNDMCFNPEKYLKEHALFVASGGNVTMASKNDPSLPMSKRNRNLEHPIVPVTEEEALEAINKMQDLYNETVAKLSGEA